jgi:ABC-2 type transport system permease protein
VDVATLVGGLCCLGLAIGLLVARPELAGWIVVGVTLYAAFNLLLSQMIFAWLERWLARRKTRELLTVLFFVVIVAVQFIGPAVNYMDHHRAAASATASQAMAWLHFADWLPPSLPLRALTFAGGGAWGMALAAVAALAVWSVVVLRLLNLRLVREYRGEVWSESAAPTRRRKTASAEVTARPRWWDRLPGWGGAAGTIAEKELRYLLRSPAMYFALAMPVVLMLILQAQGLGGGHRHGLALSGFGFPVGVAYTLLALTNLSFNQFGNDGVGAQLYFVAPVAFRTVLRGKNLALGTLIALEIVVVFIAAALVDRPPALALAAATVVGMAFASLCTFAAGNMISLTFPRKVDFSRMGKQGLRGVGSMVALAVEGGAVAIAGLAAVAGILLHRPWLGVGLELVLTAAAIVVYQYLLGPAEQLAGRQRETLLAELSKA